jgi:hypothetical protein
MDSQGLSYQTGLFCADYEEDMMNRFSLRSRSVKNQGPSPSLNFVVMMFGFAMNYYQMNLVFTLATNSVLAGWFERLMIKLDWRNDCFIRSRVRRLREPPDKIQQTQQQQSKKKRI